MAAHGHRSHVDESRPSKTRKVRIPSFAPGEVVLLVKSSQDAVDKMASVNRWLNELSGQIVVNDHPVSFHTYTPNQSDQPIRMSGGENLVTSLVQVLVNEGQAERGIILDVVHQLNERAGPIGHNITFLAASPNWLLRGAIHGFGDGGPGGLPVPVTQEGTYTEEFIQTALDNLRIALGDPSTPTNPPVNVVVLDTTYSRKELNDAVNGEHKDHSLLKTLYLPPKVPGDSENPESPLKIYEAKDQDFNIDLPPTPDQNRHYYVHKGDENHEIKDHGLFIAGIIHSWAPAAKIHLFEVLNSYGVCTLTGLGQALEKVKEMFPPSAANPPLIVNCSFCITFPEAIQAQLQHENIVETQQRNGKPVVDEERYEKPETALVSMRSVLQEILDAYKDSGVCIVAAAGNDASLDGHEGDAPATRYPAAFEGVVGVGAVDKKGDRAAYSNPADKIRHESVMMYGGRAQKAESNHAHPQANKVHNDLTQANEPAGTHPHDEDLYVSEGQDSPLGIYLSEFPAKANPESVTNPKKGWAGWSGTSFATANMSGILARLASDGYKIPGHSLTDLLTTIKAHLPINLGELRSGPKSV